MMTPRLTQSWRWFGQEDGVSLQYIRQSGASHVVTALHDVPIGEVWNPEAILARKEIINKAGLEWEVVESIPVHDDIKRRSGEYVRYIDNYKMCIRHLAEVGVKVVTYNFMPVMDWVRTDLDFALGDGSSALRYDGDAIAAFDLYILRRPEAYDEYTLLQRNAAQEYHDSLTEDEIQELILKIIAGLPGKTTSASDDIQAFKDLLATYADIDKDVLRENLTLFLDEVIPVAEEVGVCLAIHPDDLPFDILGLPRIVCDIEDFRYITSAVQSPANGICFCTGSLGVLPSNDLPAMIEELGDRIHFIHLRAVKREDDQHFYEAAHLEGEVDMYAVIRAFTKVQQRRKVSIPMRPDHGHKILDDLLKMPNPGYSAIGRLKGLAELRGLEEGVVRGLQT